MTETRTLPPEQAGDSEASPTEEERAAAIAALLGGIVTVQTVEALVSAIASLLARLPGLPSEASDLGDDVTRRVARLVVEGRQGLREDMDSPREASATLRHTHIDNLIHRAHYAINATKRVVTAEDVRKGFTVERRFFLQHREAERVRTAGAKLNEAAAERWGPILSWNDTGKAKTHRPSHLAADGKNYDVRRPPTSTGGVLPGQALHCDCVPGPPKQNAEVLR